MTPELSAILRACKDEPDDDAPRLVLADWLEDRGDEERARFIRRQVAAPPGHSHTGTPNPEWFGAWADWAADGGSTPAGDFYDRAYFSRGLLHINSHEGFPRDLGRLLGPPFEWDWVESLSGHCWSSELDWTPLLRSSIVHELSTLGIFGDGRVDNLAKQFASSQPLPHLSALHLIHVDLTDHGLATLCRTGLPRLQSLALSQNRITARGVHEIAEHPQLSRLRRLDLSMNPIGNTGAKLLAESWARTTLRRLDLGRCNIEDSGLLRLVSEEHLPNLEWLVLHSNRVTDRGVQTMLSLSRSRPLNINLGHNPRISAACQKELKQTFGESGWLMIGGKEVPE